MTRPTSSLPVRAVNDIVSLKAGNGCDVKGNSGCTSINTMIQSGAALIVTSCLGFPKQLESLDITITYSDNR